MAIFRSLISSHVAKKAGLKNYRSKFGVTERGGPSYFKATQESLTQASKPDSVGYVYAFKTKAGGFTPYSTLEDRTYHEVTPDFTIKVKFEDLPKNIEVIK